MKKLLAVLTVLLLVLAACTTASSQSPEEMITGLGTALTNGDVDAAMEYVSEDIVFDSEGELTNGAAAVREMFAELVANDFRIQQEIVGHEGNVYQSHTTTWGAGMPPAIEPLVANEEYVVEDGKITRISWYPTEESMTKMMSVMTVYGMAEALNNGDLDESVAFLADDIVFDVDGEPIEGKTGVQMMFRDLINGHFHIEYDNMAVDQNTVTTLTSTWGDGIPEEIQPNQAHETYVVKDGQITRISWVPTDESRARQEAYYNDAMPAEDSPESWLVGSWNWDSGITVFEFDADGTYRYDANPSRIATNPADIGHYSFDGEALVLESGKDAWICKPGDTATYEVTFIDKDHLEFTVVAGDCTNARDNPLGDGPQGFTRADS